MITDEDKERVRQATDLVALVAETVELRQRGQEFWGCCPFHGEKNPSFKVNSNTGLWHCFGCGEGGDVFSYVQKRENLEFPDAIRYLADRAGIELAEERGGQRGPRRNRLIECLTEAESFYSTMLMRSRSEGAAQARAYFAGRGFGSDVCRRWGLGYAPGRGALVAHLRQKGFSAREIVAADLAVDRSGRPSDRFYERVMFPIHDELGRTIAFGGRIMGKKKDVAKYVNTRDTAVFNKGKHLFAYDRAKETMAATGQAIVCEGYTDVIAMHEAGFTNAVAALGTAFRLDHVKLMERQRVHRITCMFDGDAAGQRAAERAVRYIDKTTAEFRCVVLPDDMDPMEFLAAHGADELRPILEAAVPLMDFVFAKRLEGLDLSVPGRRVAALKDMASLLAPLKHSVLLDEYATRLADTLGLEVEDTKRAIREAPVQDADDERPRRTAGPQGAAGGSGARRQAAVLARKPRAQTGSSWDDGVPVNAYDAVPVAEEGGWDVPPECVALLEAAPAAPASPRLESLSADERLQVSSERELLCALAARPDEVRPYADRIASFSWTDSRHEAMAWAMLSTPEGSSPAEVVAAAAGVVPEAPSILSGGRALEGREMPDEQKLSVVMDTVELGSVRRGLREPASSGGRVGEPGGRLPSLSKGAPDGESEGLFEEATSLQLRVNELVRKLSSSSND